MRVGHPIFVKVGDREQRKWSVSIIGSWGSSRLARESDGKALIARLNLNKPRHAATVRNLNT